MAARRTAKSISTRTSNLDITSGPDGADWRVKLRMMKSKFDERQKQRYLEYLAKTGRRYQSAAAASVCMHLVYEHLKNDKEFAAAQERALESYKDMIHEHALMLLDGVDEPIIGGENKDQIVAFKRVYPIRLVEMELKRTNPEYKERQELEVTQRGAVLLVPAPATEAEWEKLTKGDQERQALLEKELFGPAALPAPASVP